MAALVWACIPILYHTDRMDLFLSEYFLTLWLICFWFAFNLSAYDMKTKGDKNVANLIIWTIHIYRLSNVQNSIERKSAGFFFLSLKIISKISNKAIYEHSMSVTKSCS